MILVCGDSTDSVINSLCRQLDDHGYSYRLLDPAAHSNFHIDWIWNGTHPDGYIANSSWRLDLEELTSVFVRYSPEDERLSGRLLSKEPAVVREQCDAAFVALLDCLRCPVVNRPRSTLATRSKPFQTLHIRRCGLPTPRTLITTDPDEARRFYEECGRQVIFKSISRAPSIVTMMDDEDLDRLALLRYGPTQFQEFVPGTNIRVHTVGDKWVATKIDSQAIDYRYPGADHHFVQMEPATLPSDVAAGCLGVARRLQLLFAGIDLKETPKGDYYCFEVNSSPVFDYYELKSGQSIGALLAEFLQDRRC